MQQGQGPQAPGARLVALRRQVARDRETLQQAVSGLRHVVRRRTQVAPQIRARPYTFLVGALMVGLALGARR